MDAMQAPVVPEQPVDLLPTADGRDRLKVCKGTSFVDRRDTAIIILFLDTGMRLSELAGLTVDDLDMDADVAYEQALARREDQGPDDRQRHREDGTPPRPSGRHRWSASASVPTHLRAYLAVRGRHRGRPDVRRRLARPIDAQPPRRRGSRRTCPQCPPPPLPPAIDYDRQFQRLAIVR